jgi:hypothetical protein
VFESIFRDAARLSEAKTQVRNLLNEPVSLALLAEVKMLLAMPGEHTPDEIDKICENMFRMNCLHRMKAWGAIIASDNKRVLFSVHPTVVGLILHTAGPEEELSALQIPRHMPPANMIGHDLVVVFMYTCKEY